MTVLTKYLALKEKAEAKKAARKEALDAINAEFGDVDSELEEERNKILKWMMDEGNTFIIEEDGVVEVRNSREKYIVKDDKALITWLYNNGSFDALEYKKSIVNTLKKTDNIPDEIVSIEREYELMVRALEKK